MQAENGLTKTQAKKPKSRQAKKSDRLMQLSFRDDKVSLPALLSARPSEVHRSSSNGIQVILPQLYVQAREKMPKRASPKRDKALPTTKVLSRKVLQKQKRAISNAEKLKTKRSHEGIKPFYSEIFVLCKHAYAFIWNKKQKCCA